MKLLHTIFLPVSLIVISCGLSLAQVGGTKTIGVDYPTLNAALLALNSSGVGSGGVIINVPAGWTETAPLGGDTLGSTVLNATASGSNPITIQKSGGGANPLITAFTPGASTTVDGIFKIKGTDYVTIDGIDLQENPANTTPTQQMEWGYALVKLQNAAPFDGCQNVTIKNCSIALSRTNTASVGIYVNDHISTATTTLTITVTTDANSNNNFYSNTINNCYSGISVTGYSGSTSLYDQNNYLGVGGGNIITNFGGGSVTSYGIMATNQNNVKIDNNLINGGRRNHTGQIFGLYENLGTGSTAEINNNTVTLTDSATATGYGIRCNMGSSGTTNTVSITGNMVQNCSSIGTGSGSFNCIYNGGTPPNLVISNNIVTNDTLSNTGTGSLYGIAPNAVGTSTTIFNNTVSNLQGGNSTSSGIYGFYVINATIAGTTSLYGNTVQGLKGNTISVYGMRYFGNATGSTNNIYQNNVYDLSSSGTSTSHYVMGLYYSTTSNSNPSIAYVYNNFISDLRAPNAQSLPNATGFTGSNPPYSVVGIFAGNTGTAASTFSAFYNTVYMNALSSNTTFGACGLLADTRLQTDLRNNLVVNLSTPGSAAGATVAHGRIEPASNHPGLSTYLASSNNNDFYVPVASRSYMFGDSTSIGNGTADVTVSAYKNRMDPRDLQSFSENPAFVNAAGHDLHINAATPTQLESGGTVVAVLTDFDGNARSSSFPDVGADEFAGTMNDLVPPTIVYTPFNTVSPTPTHSLTATITDPSGVPTSGGGLPVAYWKVASSGTFTAAPTTSVGSGQYSFTFGSTATTGDTVFYFIVAQDGAGTPNTGSLAYSGASGFTSNPPAASTPPTSPYWYRIVATPLSGDKYIGGTVPTPDYATINLAIKDLNLRGVGGNVRFLLNASSFAESIPDTIRIYSDSIPTASKTLTIKPNTGVVATISGNFNNNGVFDVYGPYIIIDGDNGDGNRDLTIVNTNGGGTTAATYVVGLLNGGATFIPSNCTIKNCNISGGTSTFGTGLTNGIYLDGTSGGYANVIINNNLITKIRTGIQFSGASSSFATNGQITNNTIGSPTDALSCFVQGVVASFSDNLLISGNEIMGQAAGNANGANSPADDNASIVVKNSSTNTKIRKNRIHDFYVTGTNSLGAIGIAIDPGTATNSGTTEISNNIIYNIKGDCNTEAAGTAATGTVTQGICVNSTGSAPVQIFFNTIYLSGAVLGTSGHGEAFNGSSACIGIRGGSVGVGTIDIRNNILKNSQTTIDGIPNAADNQTMAIWVQAASSTNAIFGNIDYNNYYIDGNAPRIGYLLGAFSADVPAWRTATGKDINSIATSVTFVSTTDLHLSGGSIGDVSLAGTPIGGITTDIDNDTRNSGAPYMGADEIPDGPLPIQLASFTATHGNNGYVLLQWTTISEINNYGFEVQKAHNSPVNFVSIPNSFVAGHGTTNEPQHYTFADNTTQIGVWHYRLKQIDLNGAQHFTDPIRVEVLTSVIESAPKEFALAQNYPNPFNPETVIRFSVENTARTTLEVYNLLGQRVATLFDDLAEAGQYYKVRLAGQSLSSGVYVYRLQSGTRTDVKKMMLLK